MPPYRKLIVVIDDDCSIRKALERQIRAAGYRCESFASAEDFLAVAKTCKAACAVSDINLGGITGLQLTLHPVITGLNLPVVLITGSPDPMIELPAREIGAAFLRKPIFGHELLDAIVDTVGPPIGESE